MICRNAKCNYRGTPRKDRRLSVLDLVALLVSAAIIAAFILSSMIVFNPENELGRLLMTLIGGAWLVPATLWPLVICVLLRRGYIYRCPICDLQVWSDA